MILHVFCDHLLICLVEAECYNVKHYLLHCEPAVLSFSLVNSLFLS
jgi:hypothetical protein